MLLRKFFCNGKEKCSKFFILSRIEIYLSIPFFVTTMYTQYIIHIFYSISTSNIYTSTHSRSRVEKGKKMKEKFSILGSGNQHINGISSKLCGRLISELVSSISSAKNEKEKERKN